MKLQVDANRCQGTAMCVAVSPGLLQLREDGVADVLVENLDPNAVADAEEAVVSCPAAAITLIRD